MLVEDVNAADTGIDLAEDAGWHRGPAPLHLARMRSGLVDGPILSLQAADHVVNGLQEFCVGDRITVTHVHYVMPASGLCLGGGNQEELTVCSREEVYLDLGVRLRGPLLD
jgi:hypothetical protein